MEGEHKATKTKIWHQVKIDMQNEWRRRRKQVQNGTLPEIEAQYRFEFDFGQNDLYTHSTQRAFR